MLSLLLCLALSCPQGGSEEEPVGLVVTVVDVDQGNGTVIRAPDGSVHVIDAGAEGMGFQRMNGVISSLSPVSYGFTFVSHYDIGRDG